MTGFLPACPLTGTDHCRNAVVRKATEGLSGRRFLADRPGTGPGAPPAEDHMRTTRALVVSVAAVAALGLAAPAAIAWDGMGSSGGSGVASSGGDGGGMGHSGGNGFVDSASNIVALPSVIARGGQLTVTVDGCPRGGTATSPAFTSPVHLSPVHGTSGTSSGTATISNSAAPGPHSITANCTGRSPLTRDAAFTVIGGVRGGLGGSSSTGATPTDMAIGGGLVAAAAIGGGLFWMRRRGEKRT
ncbi:hypothetical protein GR925_13435 [Streptomyces sp. HUCO-GS316]|nr:hypothetical protein [Streptomyces sp. HUCO-GS316]